MASKQAVMAALTLLGRAFAGTVDAAKADVYAAALEDVSDEEVARATAILIRTHKGEFIPTPPQIREAGGANQRQVTTDVEALLKAIEQAGFYNPNTGWNPPKVERVRDLFGDAVATAYGLIGGGARLFGSDEIGRGIAMRDFGKELEAAAKSPERTALPSGNRRALGQGVG